ncbi:hypothetical protein MMC25_000007 [Agyrium rufum]|nr:hypothetical protein [Agyrium rufum]
MATTGPPDIPLSPNTPELYGSVLPAVSLEPPEEQKRLIISKLASHRFKAFVGKLSSSAAVVELPPSPAPSSPALSAGSSPTSSCRGRSPQNSRYVPIVITEDHIHSVIRDSPDSPNSDGFSSLRSFTSSNGSAFSQKRLSSPPRHIPILIPSYAHPYGPFPPSPLSSQCNTPRVSSPLSLEFPEPSLTSSQSTMSSQDPNASRTSTMDSRTSPPIDSQGLQRRTNASPSTHLSGLANSQRSVTQDPTSQQQDPRSATSQVNGRYGSTSMSSNGPQAQTAVGTTNIAGMVCNVHRCTGREPHALVGATTTNLGDKLYVFGGRKFSRRRNQLTSDLYELDLIRRHWSKIEATGDIPPPRYFHSVCALGDTKLVCYGGMSPATSVQSTQPQGDSSDQQPEVVIMSDIHIYDAASRTWTHVPTTSNPQGRYAHCATILPSSAVFTSTNAPRSAIHYNPSSDNPNQGTLGVALDGAGGAEMIVVGGQDSGNHYIEQISIFNLRSLEWTSTQSMERSCGSYRTVVACLSGMPASKIGQGPRTSDSSDHSRRSKDPADIASSMLVYSNYNFLDVKLELQVRTSDGSLTEKPMQGQYSPPGLRFPNGEILNNHFVVSGTYLTSSKQEYALWALDLRNLTWSRIEAGGSVFSTGSWNRGVLWPRRNSFVVLGNRKRNMIEDYNHRRINFSHVCIVELESFGLYDNPRIAAPTSTYISASAPSLPLSLAPKHFVNAAEGRPLFTAAKDLGAMALGIRELADMDIIAITGERIPINSHLVSRRWGPYFVKLLSEGAATQGTNAANGDSEVATLRTLNQTASRMSSITITPSIGATLSSTTIQTVNPSSASTSTTLNSTSPTQHRSGTTATAPFSPPTTTQLPPSSRSRALFLPHTPLTIHALLHYLHTSSLPPTTHHLCTPQILCSLLQIARPYKVDGLLEAVIERLHQVMDGRNAAAVFNAAAMAAGGGRATAGTDAFGSDLLDDGYADDPEDFSNGNGTNGYNAGAISRPGVGPDGSSTALSDANLSRANLGRMNLRIDTSFANPSTNGRGPSQTNDAVRRQQQQQRGRSQHDASAADSEDDNVSSTSEATSTTSTNSFNGEDAGRADHADGNAGYLGRAVGRMLRDEADGFKEVWTGGQSCVVGLQKRGLRGLMEGRRMRERGRSLVGGGGGGGGPDGDG